MVNNLIIEKNILASCLCDAKESLINFVVESLSEDDFFDLSHKEIFNAIKTEVSQGNKVTLAGVEILISESSKSKYYDLFECASFVNVDDFINKLQKITMTRKLMSASHKFFTDARSTKDYDKLNDDFEKIVFEIMQNRKNKNNGFWLKDGLSDYFKELQHDIENNRQDGIKTGIPTLDNLTGGFRGGEQIVVAGRPSMGKSSFALSMITKHILDEKKPALFSFEMGKREIYDKIMSMTSDRIGTPVAYAKLRNPYNIQGLSQGLKNSTEPLNKSNMYVNCDTSLSFNEIKSICRELKYKNMLDIVYIDHIGLMVKDRKNERAELTEITNNGKKLASELDIPVVLIVQLRRDLDTGGTPNLGHLKGSGSIEEDANIVLFPWRPSVIDRSKGNESEAILIMAKSRNSGVQEIPMYFSTETTLFTETTKREKEPIRIIKNEELAF